MTLNAALALILRFFSPNSTYSNKKLTYVRELVVGDGNCSLRGVKSSTLNAWVVCLTSSIGDITLIRRHSPMNSDRVLSRYRLMMAHSMWRQTHYAGTTFDMLNYVEKLQILLLKNLAVCNAF